MSRKHKTRGKQRKAAPILSEVAAEFEDFAEPNPGKPVVVEVASSADGRDITLGYVDRLPYLPGEDAVLSGKGDGTVKLYEDLYSDPDVKIAWDQRSLGLVAKEWRVEPGATDRQSKKAAAQLQEALEHVAWDNACQKQQFGVMFGYAFAELMWAADGSRIMLDRIKVKKARRFRFAPDGSALLLTAKAPNGEKLPPRKFWGFNCGAIDDDEPYGLGLGHWLYWPVWFRRNGEKFWALWLETLASGVYVGKHPPGGDPKEKDKLLRAIKSLRTGAAVAISDNMLIEALQAARSAGGDYDVFARHWESKIYRLIVGQDFTIQAKGGQNKGDNLMDVFNAIIKADADLLNQSFAQQAATWLRDWNWPGAAVPQVWRRFEDAPDLKALSETHKNVFSFGYRPTLEEVTETYGGEWEPVSQNSPAEPMPGTDGPSTPPGQPAEAGADGSGAEFAEPSPPAQADTVAGFTQTLGQEADPLIKKLLDPVRKLLAESADLAEVDGKLAGLYSQMDSNTLAALLAEGFVAAELAGRYELQHDTGLDP